MAAYRKEKVASLVRELLSEALALRMQDPRIEALTTVTRVEMTGDLQIAKVFLSIPGGDAVERRTMAGIRHAGGFLQRLVAGQLSLRHCPQLRFQVDDSAKTVRHILDLLDRNRALRPDSLDTEDVDRDGSDAGDDDGDQGAGDQGAGDQGIGDQGIGDQGIGNESSGNERSGADAIGDQCIGESESTHQ